jgi:hypothetical protein
VGDGDEVATGGGPEPAAEEAPPASATRLGAAEVLQRVAREPVVGVVVTDRLELAGSVEHEIVFEGCTFEGDVDLSFARFASRVAFQGCTFRADADFRSSHFEAGMGLDDCTFTAAQAPVRFYDSTFAAPLAAERLTSRRPLEFRRNTFASDISFFKARVDSLELVQIEARGTLHLQHAVIGATAPTDPRAPIDPASRATQSLLLDRCQLQGGILADQMRCGGPILLDHLTAEGPVDLYRVKINGRLDVLRAKLGTLGTTDARIAGDVAVTAASISGDFVATGLRGLSSYDWLHGQSPNYAPSRLESPAVTLNGTTVSGALSLRDVAVRSLSASGLRVGGQLDLRSAHIWEKTSFFELVVSQGAFFPNARLGGVTSFAGATFETTADFCDAELGELRLREVRANSIKCLRTSAKVLSGEGLRCSNLSLAGMKVEELLLRGAQITGSLDLPASVAKKVDLSYATLGGELDVADLETASLVLLGTTLPVLILPGYSARLPAQVDLRACNYRVIGTSDGSQLRGTEVLSRDGACRQVPFDRQPFEHLAGVLRNIGLDDDARAVQIQKNRFASKRKRGIARAIDRCWDLMACYGYSRSRPVAGFLLCVALAAAILTGVGAFEPPADKAGQTGPRDCRTLQLSFGEALYYATTKALPSPSLPDRTVCQPVTSYVRSRGLGRQPFLALVLLRIAGWIFAPLAILSLTGFLRKLDK